MIIYGWILLTEVVITSGVRTPIGNFGGALKSIPTVKLGAIVINEVLKRANLKPVSSGYDKSNSSNVFQSSDLTDLEKKYYDWADTSTPITIDEVIMGHVLQAGEGQNCARQASIYAGVPKETPAFTINKVCGSGLKAIALGAQSILTGQSEIVVAGGMENMSSTPYALQKARWGYRMDPGAFGKITDLMVYDGLWEIFYGYHMGNTAENIAEKYGISREEQDQLGFESHKRAKSAINLGLFKTEIKPVEVPQRKGDPLIFDTDERPMDTSLERMAALKPVFRKEGTVTAGNASGINDAAAAVLLMSKKKAEELDQEILGVISSFSSGGIDPAYMGLGPIPAVRKSVNKAGVEVSDIDVIELNEAFASQAIACIRELDLDISKTNPVGSGIALGHPIGATGTRQVVTILNTMKRQNLKLGLVTMCIGGGQGMAMVLKRES